jgi:hypothetical protein
VRGAWPLPLLVLVLVSCGGQPAPPPDPTVVAPSEPAVTAGEPTTTTTATASELPEGLVGAWSSSQGDATLAFRFLADGSYRHAGVLTQPRATGVFELRLEESGRVSVNGSRLTLRPRSRTTIRKDPDDPGGDYQRPMSREPRRYTWRLDTAGGRKVLYLTDARGVEVSYEPA